MGHEYSDDVRKRAREICAAILDEGECTDTKERAKRPQPKEPCDPSNCYIWELIEMGRKGSPE